MYRRTYLRTLVCLILLICSIEINLTSAVDFESYFGDIPAGTTSCGEDDEDDNLSGTLTPESKFYANMIIRLTYRVRCGIYSTSFVRCSRCCSQRCSTTWTFSSCSCECCLRRQSRRLGCETQQRFCQWVPSQIVQRYFDRRFQWKSKPPIGKLPVFISIWNGRVWGSTSCQSYLWISRTMVTMIRWQMFPQRPPFHVPGLRSTAKKKAMCICLSPSV